MSESNTPSEDPKIIVDDDWKAQVQKEKEAATNEPPSAPEQAGDVAGTSDQTVSEAEPVESQTNDSEAGDIDQAGQLPPASLEVHISMLLSQCMAALGQMPGPDGNPTEINKPFAKHFIDTIEMLQEKTQGNVTDAEQKMMADVLHAMRMAFVSAKSTSS